MGYGSYSETAYHTNVQSRLQTHGVRAFTHTHDISLGRAPARVHPRLDPRALAGEGVRESRDSEAHPNSLAIGVFFDVTGSMGHLPGIIQRKLPALMGLLVTRGYTPDPQVLFGAVQDYADRAPLQVGQFESDVQMDEDLDKVYIESGGRGSDANHEGYGLVHYAFARHTSVDCWERRQKKGYCITIGDEQPNPVVPASIVREVFGDPGEGVLRTADLVAECRRRFHVYHVIATQGSGYRSAPEAVEADWRALVGADHVVLCSNVEHVAELVGVVVGLTEGTTTLPQAEVALADMGVSTDAIAAIRQAVDPLARAVTLRT